MSMGGMVEGNSIAYALAKIAVFGEFLPNGQNDVFVNQLAWAGWTGLFVTGLNLIPLGQLDGGHVMYALLGRRARALFYPLIAGLAVMTVLSGGALIFILLLLILLGRTYAVPLDDISKLDQRRRRIAIFTLVIFLLVFVPVPLSVSSGPSTPVNPDNVAPLLSLGVASVITGMQHILRMRHLR
jgi:membrane-associated protease RseP (regulator of RpoE activity)